MRKKAIDEIKTVDETKATDKDPKVEEQEESIIDIRNKKRTGRPPNPTYECDLCKKTFERALVPPINVSDSKTVKILCCPDCASTRRKILKTNKDIADLLFDLCDGDKAVMPFLTKQVSQLAENKEYSLGGILATLRYAYYVIPNHAVFNEAYGVQWTVLKYYSLAKKHYEKIWELRKQPIENIDNALQTEVKVIHLDSEELAKQDMRFNEIKKNKIYGPNIDLDAIDDEEEINGEN